MEQIDKNIRACGKILKTHGVKGEVTVLVEDAALFDTDYIIVPIDGLYVPFFIESRRGKSDNIDIIKIEDIDSDSFDELGESYLKEAYENVKSFKTNKVYKKNGKLVVEGIVSFKSGKNKKTSFIFESAHNKSKKKVLLGENKQITPNSKSFRLRGVVKNKRMVCESLRYNYKEGKNRVSGVCRVK